jgi:hypothetical protein
VTGFSFVMAAAVRKAVSFGEKDKAGGLLYAPFHTF